MKLEKIVSFKGSVHCVSGLYIGGMGGKLKIGGIDSETVRHPVTGEPYIPGSSLKGKMRSQLEKKLDISKRTENYKKNILKKNRFEYDGEPCMCGEKNCVVCCIFGAHMNTKAASSPTRIIVRDCFLIKKDEAVQQQREEGTSYFEQKAENIINRQKGTAGDPRFIERVAAGVDFTLDISLQIFEGDNQQEMVNAVEKALELVMYNYLGGLGSRGYGQVKFDYKIDEHVV